MRTPTLAIIGGGASGMAAAIAASGQGVAVVLCESQARLGRKLLATGNGRCNLSHQGFSDANYHGTHPHFVHEALARYDEADTLVFFEKLGLVVTTDERQRYYPATLQAAAVLDVLRLAIEEAGVRVCTETRIERIQQAKNGHFILRHKGGSIHADAVIGHLDEHETLLGHGHADRDMQRALVAHAVPNSVFHQRLKKQV